MAIVINGSGTVTGLAVGGLPDGTVDAGTLATDSVVTGKIADGTIANADIADLAASKLTGALPAISGASLTGLPAGGKILQCISVKNSAAVQLSAGTGMTDIITQAITPSATSSKILVQVNISYYKQTTAVASSSYNITRGSTTIDSTYWHYSDSAFTNWWMPYQVQVLDSPSTTSATTYKFRLSNSGGNVIGAQDPTKITLWEIGA